MNVFQISNYRLVANCLGLVLFQSLSHAQHDNIAVLGSMGGAFGGGTVHGNYAYIRDGHSFVVVDLSTPGVLNPVRRLPLLGQGGRMAVVGTKAYVSIQSHGIQVIDISDPPNASLLETITVPGANGLFTFNGQIAYNMQNQFTLGIYDISNPSNPFLIRTHGLITFADPFLISGNRGVAADAANLGIVDFSNPTQPRNAGVHLAGCCPGNVFLKENVLFFRMGLPQALHFVDVSDADNPVPLGTFSAFGSAFQVLDYQPPYVIYSAGSASTLRILDISNPAMPVVVGTYPSTKSTTPKGITNSIIFNGPNLFDISDPSSPTLVGTYDRYSLEFVQNVHVHYPFAFAADHLTGVTIFDISDPGTPYEVSNTTIPYRAFDIDYKEPYIYAAFGTNENIDRGGLQVIEASNLAAPVKSGSIEFGRITDVVAVLGTAALIKVQSFGFRVVDVSNPSNPNVIHANSTIFPRDIQIVGSLAYITTGGSLRVLDISNPATPNQIGSLPLPGAGGLDISGEWAFITNGNQTLHLVNISNPTNPFLYKSVQTFETPNDVSGDEYLVYVASNSGIEVFTLVDPFRSARIGYLQTTERARNVDVSHGRAYVTLGWEGLIIVQFTGEIPPSAVDEWNSYE